MEQSTYEQVVNHMLEKDAFSTWLGIEIVQITKGYSKIRMTIRPEMVNGFGIVHGGIAFSLADSAFAFACNNRNRVSVALDTHMSFIKAVHVGDELTAEATELHYGSGTGVYTVAIYNQHQHQVGFFKGTCFHTKRTHLPV